MTEIALILEPPIARIRLARPDRRNAMSRAMWRALPTLCARIAAAPETLVVIVEGSHGHFCAGADIAEFETVYRDAAATRDYTDAIQVGLAALAALDRPTIAALRGNAIGGGLALALCCDLRFCAADAVLAITPARLGLLYGFVETRRLVETVGPARAKDLLFSGRRIGCSEALAIGLIDRLVDPASLDAVVSAYAEDLARLSQLSIRGAKFAVDAIAGGLSAETGAFRALVEQAAAGEDFAEGRAAFMAKRTPRFGFRGRGAPVD
ncbi:MAG: enoyl-CoA hydratase-related protein [Roseiarcus sp.]|jgi:enoyl-CoA hydratase/carnithine racemase